MFLIKLFYHVFVYNVGARNSVTICALQKLLNIFNPNDV